MLGKVQKAVLQMAQGGTSGYGNTEGRVNFIFALFTFIAFELFYKHDSFHSKK